MKFKYARSAAGPLARKGAGVDLATVYASYPVQLGSFDRSNVVLYFEELCTRVLNFKSNVRDECELNYPYCCVILFRISGFCGCARCAFITFTGSTSY